MAEHRWHALPLTTGVLALLAAALFVLDDATSVDITAAAGWALGLALVGLAGVVVGVQRLRPPGD